MLGFGSGCFQQGSGFLELSQSEQTARQSEHAPLVIFLLSDQFAEERHRLRHSWRIDQRANQADFIAADGVLARLLNVLSGRRNITKFNQLSDRQRGLRWVLTSLAVMQTGLAITHTFPTKDAFGLGLLAEHFQPRTPVHVAAHRQAEQCQNRGGHIQKRRAVKAFVFLDVRSLQARDAEIPVAPLRILFGFFRWRTAMPALVTDRKSTRLNSSHLGISY